jgi:hypothetical protein
VIADVVNFAIAGIGFIHAVGRLIVRKGLAASTNTFMTQKRARRHDQCRGPNISALTKVR